MTYIATFYSHFGAVRIKKDLARLGIEATLMPVPRALSSSCGTCAQFTTDSLPEFTHPDEIEQVVTVVNDSYSVVFSTMDD